MANNEISAFDFFGDEIEIVDAKVREDIKTLNTQFENIANELENVVTYTPEDGDEDFITAENIAFSDTNFTSKNVKGALTELFQSASNGKSLIATAITGKGVDTNTTDSFETMANNIANIVTNGADDSDSNIESGSFTCEEYQSSLEITTINNCSSLILVCSETSNTDSIRFIYALIVTNICKISISSNLGGTSITTVNTNKNISTFNGNIISIASNDDSKFMPCKYEWVAW